MRRRKVYNLLFVLAAIVLLLGCAPLNDTHTDKISKDASSYISINGIDKENKSGIYREAIEIIDKREIAIGDDSKKQFVKEYTYRASDDDSKNSAREKALQQLKVQVSEEVGVYIESYLEINTEKHDNQVNKLVRGEIKSLSAGITKTKIIEEDWNGKEYFVKATISINPDSVVKGISEALKARVTEKEVQRLEKILKEQLEEMTYSTRRIKELQKRVASKAILNEARKNELEIIKKQLEEARRQLAKYTQEQARTQSELVEIIAAIGQSTRNAYKVVLGMTRTEVVQVAGPPRSKSYDSLIYGRLWVKFEDGVVGCIVNESPRFLCREYRKSPNSLHLIK